MNIFKKLAISIMFLGIMQSVFSQQPTHASQQKVDIPFYSGNAVYEAFHKQTTSDTIWLPASVNYFSNGRFSLRYVYEYHKDGLLKKFTTHDAITGELIAICDLNNTYLDPLTNILDTVFYVGYVHPVTGEYHPPYRYYYNNRQADSLYWEEYYQAWDGDRWKTGQKIQYVHYLPDTATVSEWQHHVERFDGNGVMIDG
ncbi:MAG: hypothetical protein LBU83_06550, partial [Bacteroidales bacterium]|nr:hypothetical protein [Bacteroidales bacterium]